MGTPSRLSTPSNRFKYPQPMRMGSSRRRFLANFAGDVEFRRSGPNDAIGRAGRGTSTRPGAGHRPSPARTGRPRGTGPDAIRRLGAAWPLHRFLAMPSPPARPRPTSPHLQIYRWQIGNSLSIVHRLTGIALAVGLVALSYWLVSLAGGERSYAAAARVFASPVGLAALMGWTFAFLFHLLNGVRHLFWDMRDTASSAPNATRAAGWWSWAPRG